MRRTSMILVGVVAAAALGFLGGSARAYQRPWGLERVSVADDGSQGNGWAPYAAISGDGRFVAFHSTAPDLVPGDTNNQGDIFVRDRKLGRTIRVSVASDGTQANNSSDSAVISGDGRYVAFFSWASNLAPNLPMLGQVFVHDLHTGRTELASANSAEEPANSYSFSPAISADGRYVAFSSIASNLVPGDANAANFPVGTEDVFVRDLQTGTTELVSVASDGTQGNGVSKYPTISADGRYVAFQSDSSNLVANDINVAQDPLFKSDVFVHDRVTDTTELVSVTSDEMQGAGAALFPVVSATGRYVAFVATASNLVPNDGNRMGDVFVRDRELGTTERISVSSSGREGDNSSLAPSITADGRFVTFGSDATNLVAGDVNRTHDSFVHDRLTGITERLSVDAAGGDVVGQAITPKITADGRQVAFGSYGPLVEDDTNNNFDIYVVDRGPSLGVSGLSASRQGDAVQVTGAATLDGVVVSSGTDPAGDAPLAAGGLDLTGASISYRPEAEDLLIEWRASSMPAARGAVWTQPGVGGVGPTFQVTFTFGGAEWIVQGTRLWTNGNATGLGEHQFFVYRCQAECLGMGEVQGSVGTTGDSAAVSLPLSKLTGPGDRLQNIQAEVYLQAAGAGDVVLLPATPSLTTEVSVGAAPRGQGADGFQAAGLSGGRFSTTVPIGGTGEHDVLVRVCRAGECTLERVPVAG